MKKITAIALSALVIAGAFWQGEALFNAALRGWLAVHGVHSNIYEGTGGTRVHWFEGGEEHGQTVILLHGVGGNAQTSWFRMLPELADRYHVIAPDLFFANLPDLVNSDYRIGHEQLLLDILYRECGVSHASLVGLSFGAWPAMQKAIAEPAKVDALVLVSPFSPDGWRRVAQMEFLTSNPGKEFYYRIFETPPPVPEIFLKSHWDRTTRVFEALPKFAGELESVGRGLRRGLQRVNCPALIVYGDHDAIVPQEQIRKLAGALKHGEVVELPSCGHAVVWDKSDMLFTVVESFLDGQEAAQ
ncbi:alpha/beta hydrolase [uncultured Pseudodesulfovibrio sp.]|uniref:alpha/beta fold hydrolase n=1 Tax=uncultured Pseudodesulfovibrio sp. TaxID=2035858 RepID=UPI0029C83D26|nr:alpha/beta hydrolase [uncultured Pseudodesulfovibrio sp.]